MPEVYEVEVTKAVEDDLFAIWSHIAVDSVSNADRFVDALEEKVLSLSRLPERGPVIPEAASLRVRSYRHLIYRDYRIGYRVAGRKVFVLRVFHGSKPLDVPLGQ